MHHASCLSVDCSEKKNIKYVCGGPWCCLISNSASWISEIVAVTMRPVCHVTQVLYFVERALINLMLKENWPSEKSIKFLRAAQWTFSMRVHIFFEDEKMGGIQANLLFEKPIGTFFISLLRKLRSFETVYATNHIELIFQSCGAPPCPML